MFLAYFWWVSLLRFFRQAHGARADTRARTGSGGAGCVCVCVWGWGEHMATLLRVYGKRINLVPQSSGCVQATPRSLTPFPRPPSPQPEPHTNPWPLPGRGLHPRVCVFRLQSYWVVRIDLDTRGRKKKRQIAPLIPKCLLPSAATCSCWDLHNE